MTPIDGPATPPAEPVMKLIRILGRAVARRRISAASTGVTHKARAQPGDGIPHDDRRRGDLSGDGDLRTVDWRPAGRHGRVGGRGDSATSPAPEADV